MVDFTLGASTFLLCVSGYWISSGCLEMFPPLGISSCDLKPRHTLGAFFHFYSATLEGPYSRRQLLANGAMAASRGAA